MLYVYVFSALIFSIYLASLVWHEFGHMWAFRVYANKKIKGHLIFKNFFNVVFYAGTKEDYVGITKKQYQSILSCGILFGIIPIFFGVLFSSGEILLGEILFLMIIPYFMSIKKDISIFKAITK